MAERIAVVGLLGGRPVGAEAERLLRSARIVAGGKDQLAGVADLVGPDTETVVVGAGLGALDTVAAADGPVVVLASGDPGFHGIVRALGARVGADRLDVHPAPSSVALAFARLGLAWDSAAVCSCHTGGPDRARSVAGAPLAAVLCGPDAPPERIGAVLRQAGAHPGLVAVCTRLGEPGEEVVRLGSVAELAAGTFDHRSVVVLAHPAPAVGSDGGRPVADFLHRASMITKPEVRSVVLGKLDLPATGVFWDVGAGSGSVAIEAAVARPGLRVIAVEQRADDVERILANAAHLGALVEVVEGPAPLALQGLPAPDRVFVGGGGLDVVAACRDALAPGGRIVATFAAVDRAAAAGRELGNLVQVSVGRAEPLPDGGLRLAADNPVFVAWGPATAVAPASVSPALGTTAGNPSEPAGLTPSATTTATASPTQPPFATGSAPASASAGSATAAPVRPVALNVAVTPGVTVVGLGPGSPAHRTPAAVAALRSATAVVGYGPYVDAVAALLRPSQRVVRSDMGAEAVRASTALDLAAEGHRVALVSSGDPGVFAMGSVTLELAMGRGIAVDVVPGVTAASAAAAVIGAPLAGPHAFLTLSDILIPWTTIEAQLRAAAAAGMAIALYNPRSAGRPDNLTRALAVLGAVLPATTPVGVVTDASGPDESVIHATLATLDVTAVGMRSLVVVAGPETLVQEGKMVALRNHPKP